MKFLLFLSFLSFITANAIHRNSVAIQKRALIRIAPFDTRTTSYGTLDQMRENAEQLFKKKWANVASVTINGLVFWYLKNEKMEMYVYSPSKHIGQGGHSTVYPGYNLVTGKKVAIKTILSFQGRNGAIRETENAAKMGMKAGNPVFGRSGLFWYKAHRYIILKFIDGVPLEIAYLYGDLNYVFEYYRQAKLLVYKMHSLDLYHGDTNTLNFIVDKKHKVHIVDFQTTETLRNRGQEIKDFEPLCSNSYSELKRRGRVSPEYQTKLELINQDLARLHRGDLPLKH